MPSRGEVKRKRDAAWRGRTSTPAYMRWLHERRYFRMETGDFLRGEIRRAMAAENGYATNVILWDALDEVDRREEVIGNRFDHERQQPFWDANFARGAPRKRPTRA